MPADERIDAIFEAQERLLEELNTAIENKDVEAQRLITIKLARLQLSLKRIETAHRVILAGLMASVQEETNPEKRQQVLLDAFKYAAWVRSRAQDELVDDDLSNDAEIQLQGILDGLDAIPPEGRGALAPFLVSHNPDERACAGAALLEVMPERAVPVLRDLSENAAGTSAGDTALDALEKRR